MANLYIITGPAGVGKSTISIELAKTLEKSVLIEGDDFYHHVISSYIPAWKEGNHLEIFWKVCIDTINNYLKAGYDVVFNYIISKEQYMKLKEEFKNINTKFVVLLADEDTITKRDLQRDESCRMNERCIVLLNNFIKYNYDEKYIINTDKVEIKDIVNEILEKDIFII